MQVCLECRMKRIPNLLTQRLAAEGFVQVMEEGGPPILPPGDNEGSVMQLEQEVEHDIAAPLNPAFEEEAVGENVEQGPDPALVQDIETVPPPRPGEGDQEGMGGDEEGSGKEQGPSQVKGNETVSGSSKRKCSPNQPPHQAPSKCPTDTAKRYVRELPITDITIEKY
jgi:hypothetical protein